MGPTAAVGAMRRTTTITAKSHSLTQLCAARARSRSVVAAVRAPSTTTTTTIDASRSYSSSTRRVRSVVEVARPRLLSLPIAQSSSSPRRWLSSSSQADKATNHPPLPYYALFPQTLPDGPPPTGPFSIDVRTLRREFLQLQAASHPDFYHSAAASSSSSTSTPSSSSSTNHSASRRQAEAVSSHINAAYKTLSSPLLRAQYLLAERYGIDLAGDEASSLTGPPDAELLTEVLYARETIEEATSEKDLEGVRAENDERIDNCLVSLADAFAQEDVRTAVRETVRLRYWENIRESVHNWEEGKPIVLQH